ncbi:hypothetical protein DQ226_02515 [Dietzia maris]|uniref:DUF1707 domain-containing protein n=1 Tax=Dietzia maris TaxID=37915 RepID=A0A365PDT4_9ACTN|nr:hypothetical protein DQ226_02515 [Dietzia maris]
MAKHRNRASDAQRTAVQQALDEAFAAGRLDHFEHFERLRTATKAKYIDELRPLVADLRGGDDDLGLDGDDDDNAHTGSAHTGWDARRREDLSHAKRGWTIGIAVAVAVLAIAGGAIAANVADGPSTSASTEHASAPGPLHTLDGMTQMLAAAEAEFGDQDIDTIGIHGDSASLMLEDPTEPGKRLIYLFRGQWQQSNFDSHPASNTFRLADIDPGVVMAAIDAAPGELDMDDDARTSHVSVYPDALGQPEYVVNVSEGPGKPLGNVTVGVDGQVREVQQPR